jgi:tetratricopeptide (TPR) repeat protein/transglutaminase-like putative cysteine protease
MTLARSLCAAGSLALLAASLHAQESSPDRYAKQPIVMERFYQRVRFEPDGTARRDIRVRARVQTEAGVQQLGEIPYGYNSAEETLAIDSVFVHKAGGGTVAAGPDAVQDVTAPIARLAPVYSDLRYKILTVPSLRPGDTLEVHALWIRRTPVAPGQFWFQEDFPTTGVLLDGRLELDAPRATYLKVKSAPGVVAAVSDSGDRRIYRWKHSNLDVPTDDDKQRTATNDAKPQVHSVQISTFHSWADVGRWYGDLARERETVSPEIRAKARELVRDRRTRRDSLRALYDFVSKDYRYVSLSFGVGRYQPHLAAEVLANKYGDCKDKHTLLASLLAAVDLHAYPALVSSGSEIDIDVPSPSQFDHVISAIPDGDGFIWLDTTPGVAPFGFLFDALRGKQTLVITGDPAPRLYLTPREPPFPTQLQVDVTGRLTEFGGLKLKVRHLLRGEAEVLVRLAFRTVGPEQWKSFASSLAGAEGLDGDVDDVQPGNPTDTGDPFQFSYQLSKSRDVAWSGKRARVTAPLPRVDFPVDTSDTAGPHKSTPDQEYAARLKLALPAGITARPPVPVAVARPYGEYRSTYRVQGDTIAVERTLHLTGQILSRAEQRDLSSFLRVIRDDERQAISLERASADADSTVPASATADELHSSALAALNNGDPRTALRLFRRVVELEPRHRFAWNNLGRAQLQLRMLDSAVAAFKQQIQINQYDQYAYNNLGLAYWRQRKYSEAADAFRQQLKVSPLDRFAHSNLGRMYAEQHRDSAAVGELEQAISISADDAQLHVDLGKAYLNVGDQKRAQDEFDRAVELAPTPMVWNNVAYAYAVQGVNLPRAEQYARSAVDATTATLRNVNLDRVGVRDAAAVSSLAAFWDTLGWVYFREGNLPAAERYVRAAWLLRENGEVGDHLAQIEEQLGRKEDAIKSYALALAADRPLPETRARLAKLLGNDRHIGDLVDGARNDLVQLRSVRLNATLKEDVQGTVTLLFGPGPKVEDIKFMSGSDRIRLLEGALRSARYPLVLPDSTPVKVLRRGVVTCGSDKGTCVVVLDDPVRGFTLQ